MRLPDTQARTINDRHMPDVNCQYMLAVAMLDGKIDFQNSHDFERMHDPQVLEMKKRVELVADPELTKIFPAVRSAIVEINMVDGGQFKVLEDRDAGRALQSSVAPRNGGEVSLRSAIRSWARGGRRQ